MAGYAHEDEQVSLASDHSPLRDAQSASSSIHEHEVEEEKQTPSSRHQQSLLALWWFEILAACFSVACIAGMIALLISIHGKPYEPWHALGASITPNAILSILSTFSKSSLLLAVAEALGQLKWIYFQQRAHRLLDLQIFDEASRGPLGALRLIWAVRLQALVAAIGAIIVVLTMAMDPFTQQILSFPTAHTNMTNATAEIGSSQGFGLLLGPSDSIKVNAKHGLAVQEAVTFGILSSELNPLQFNCPSGHCSWPKFNTLGVCNKCVDVRDQLNITCHYDLHEHGEWPSKICTYMFPVGEGTHDELAGDYYRFKPKEQWVITVRGGVTHPGDLNRTVPVSASSSNIQTRVSPNSWLPLIAMVEQIKWREDLHINETVGTFRHNGENDKELPEEALQCYISWCEQTRESTQVKANVLFDTPSSITDLITKTRFHGYAYKKGDPYSDLVFPMWPADGPRPPESSLDVSNWNNEAGDVYWIGSDDSSSIGFYIQKAFSPGSKQMDEGNERTGWMQSVIANRILMGNISVILDSLAASLTTTVRTLNQTRTIPGTVTQPVTHVHVNWYWLIYPASLVLLAALFLIASIAFSTERHGSVWKTSILPLLFCRVDEHEVQDDSASALRDLEHSARWTQAQLAERNGNGRILRFQPPYDGDG